MTYKKLNRVEKNKKIYADFENAGKVKINSPSYFDSRKLLQTMPSPPLSEFCTDEYNSVIRSAMDALRNSKK